MEKWRFILALGLCSLLMACRATSNGNGSGAAEPATRPAAPTATKQSPAETATGAAITTSPEVSTPSDGDTAGTGPLQQKSLAHFPEAGSIDFTVNGEGRIYLAYGAASNVYVTQSGDGGATFAEPVVASHEENVFVYALERPAIVAGPDGRIHVAWPEDDYPGHIWYAVSDDDGQTFGPSLPLSGPGPETVLVRLLWEPAGSLIAVWLQNSELHFTRSGDNGDAFAPDQMIDDQTCDCCHPQPHWLNGQLFIAYRNLVIDDRGQDIRDIYLVKSPDGGDTFAEPVRVSDAPWYIAACPFSGPSLASDGEGTLYVSWMDGRNDTVGDLSQTDIWLATSADGGQTFSPNRRVNETGGVYNNLPSLALDENGRLHIIWQAREAERDVLYYTTSTDDGHSFAPPQVLVDSTDNEGRRPTNASLFVGPTGVVYASWVDSEGGYLATWQAAGAGDE